MSQLSSNPMDILKLGLPIIDIIVIFIIYSKLNKRFKFMGINTAGKIIVPSAIIFLISSYMGLKGVSGITLMIMGLFPFAVAVSQPREFKNMLEDFQGRKVSPSNIEKLLTQKNEGEVVDAVYAMARTHIGSAIVIARQDEMLDLESSGDPLGEIEITKEMLVTLFLPHSAFNKGAVLIRDNKIVAANCRMPIVQNEQIYAQGGGNRHFGLFGVAYNHDAIAIGSSADSGTITLGGPLGDEVNFNLMQRTKDDDIKNGITRDTFTDRLHLLIVGKETKNFESSMRQSQTTKQNMPDKKTKPRTKEEKEEARKLAVIEKNARAEKAKAERQAKLIARENEKRKR